MAVKINNRQAYKANIDLAFEYNDKRIKIKSERIVYLMIEHDYENRVLPVIYISLTLSDDLYTKVIKYKESAKFYLKITKKNKNSIASISKKAIEGTFNYVPSTTNPNYSEDLNLDIDMDDGSYKRIMIGLVSIELTNSLRQSYNSIYKSVDTETLIGIAIAGTRPVIEKIKYNTKYNSILLPPVTTRYKFLEYIFDKDPWYNTKFRYFMDFEKSYLVSKEGNGIDAQDGQFTDVLVDIRSVTEDEAYYDGIEIKNNAYYIYINPANSNVVVNESTDKVTNRIIGVDEDGIQSLSLDINNTKGSTVKNLFLRTSNASIIKNEMETNTVIVEILKNHIDGSAFTPNKCIIVKNYGEYSKYNGKYLIMYKKEFYKTIGGEFVLSCMVGLKKIGKVQTLYSKKEARRSGRAVSSTISKTSTAYKKDTANITLRNR